VEVLDNIEGGVQVESVRAFSSFDLKISDYSESFAKDFVLSG
jgi:hypothetical protein